MTNFIDLISFSKTSANSLTPAARATSEVPFVAAKTLSYSTIGVAGGAAIKIIDGAVPDGGLPWIAIVIIAGALAILTALAFFISDRVRHPENLKDGNWGLYILAALLNTVLLFGCVAGLGDFGPK